MNRILYRPPQQQRARTKVGRRANSLVGSVVFVPVADFGNIVHGTKAVTAFAMDSATKEDSQLAGRLLRVIRSKRDRKGAPETPPITSAELPQSEVTWQGSFKFQTNLVAALLQHSVDIATVQSKEVHELTADDGTRYPLRVTMDLAKRMIGNSSRFYFCHSDVLDSLIGEDRDDETALSNFAAGFHRLVKAHWNKPTHLQTEEDEKVNRVLEYLVDWDRQREVNPIEQPLWGKVLEFRSDGGVTVEWLIGPNDEQGETTTIKSKDICAGLREIPVGCWFYGSGKVYPARIEWIDQPVETPDPYDRDAISQAWDLIPRSVLSEIDSWPLKKEE